MRWALACDNEERRQAIRTAVANSGTGAVLDVCRTADAVAQVAQSHADLVLLAPDGSIEDKIPWLREIAEVAGCDVIVVGAASQARTVMQVLDAGISRFVDHQDVEARLPEALQSLAKNPAKRPQRGRVICVAGAGGGSGASTIVANLAVAMNRGAQAIAIDLRLEAGDLASLLDLQCQHSIADFCELEERMESEMFENCLAEHKTGVRLLAAPRRLSDICKVTSSGVRRALCMARQRCAYVIVDVGQPHRPEHAEAIRLAETIVVVMCLDFTALRQTQRILDYLDDLKIDRQKVKIVVNRRGRPGELRVSEVESALGVSAICLLPDDPKRIVWANNQGTPVVEWKPRSRISRSLVDLARSMNGSVVH
jgi:pilus assembly protein CpaE